MNKKELEIQSLTSELKERKIETEGKLEKKYREEITKFEKEIIELKNEAQLKEAEHTLKVEKALYEKEKEIDTLHHQLEQNKSAFLIKEKTMKESYEEKIKDREEQILYYKDFRTTL